LARPLPSPASATAPAALFGGVTGTTERSDFPPCRVALAYCYARAPSGPCMRVPTHTAQAGHEDGSGTNRRERPAPLPPCPLVRVRWSVHSVTGASNLSVGSGICVTFGSQAHLSTSAPSRARHVPSGIRPVIRTPSGEGPGPAACGFLLSFDCRHSLLGHPLPPGLQPPLLSAYRPRIRLRGPGTDP
jgi:hypothetical protein